MSSDYEVPRAGRAAPAPCRAERARAPGRFRDRAIAQFVSAQNVGYLRGLLAERTPAGPLRAPLLAGLADRARAFVGRGLDVLSDDPEARRGPASDLWAAVRRLNRAFFSSLLSELEDRRRAGGETEPYHMRMFAADSLRPPGLEGLNGPGPAYEFGGAPGFGGGEDDEPWDEGDPDRSHAEAMAEYYGEEEPAGPPRRYMRYEGVPFWQKGGREGVDRDVGETLQTLELGSQVRRWDMGRLRGPPRPASVGARSGPVA